MLFALQLEMKKQYLKKGSRMKSNKMILLFLFCIGIGLQAHAYENDDSTKIDACTSRSTEVRVNVYSVPKEEGLAEIKIYIRGRLFHKQRAAKVYGVDKTTGELIVTEYSSSLIEDGIDENYTHLTIDRQTGKASLILITPQKRLSSKSLECAPLGLGG